MKITFISDTHGKHSQLDVSRLTGDVICHTGDIVGDHFTEYSYTSFFEWYSKLDYGYKVYVAGNHDMMVQDRVFTKESLLEDYDIIYLEDEATEIAGYKFYGSPWTPDFNNWYFNKPLNDLESVWDKVPLDTQILLTHGPCFGIGDSFRKIGMGDNRSLVGDIHLLKKVAELPDLLIHSFGHIHDSYGTYQVEKWLDFTKRFPISINASALNEAYKLVNQPIDIFI